MGDGPKIQAPPKMAEYDEIFGEITTDVPDHVFDAGMAAERAARTLLRDMPYIQRPEGISRCDHTANQCNEAYYLMRQNLMQYCSAGRHTKKVFPPGGSAGFLPHCLC
mmetsp:Transcript_115625/g.265466  ORF Transcript_115625/g.265466 Transcript_115625/m.265466 type:complete len:108 (-) Transcript_115625:328-651(-)